MIDTDEMLRADMISAMEFFPNLCSQGMRVASPRDDRVDFARWRDHLLDPVSLDQFAKARRWWKQRRKIQQPNPTGTTRGLLAIARENIGECSVGAFQAAAISAGFTLEVDPGTWHCWVNVAAAAWQRDA